MFKTNSFATLINRCYYPFFKQAWFLCVCSTSPFKTLLEKEKLLVTSNFSLSGFPQCFGELSFLSKLKLSSANFFSLEDTKICRFGKGYKGDYHYHITGSYILWLCNLETSYWHIILCTNLKFCRVVTGKEVMKNHLFNPLPDTPGFSWPKCCGKRRKWWLPAFSPFPKRFQIFFSPWLL